MRQHAKIRDILLPIAVVAVVGMMIFPLPSGVLDALLMVNIAFSLVLLVSSVYLSEPRHFTSLPAILLLSTLFRLGLNVSTTRQILGHAEAPEIIVAFGSFVVTGSLIVGAVVFLIITVVQFLVITKGAERVAEVAARFTLDAMPGKQMAIDADVRSGSISVEEAKERRLELQQESKLYGALDGAMKFIKGDAIAGLIIIVINITAGLAVGVTQMGLSFSEALHKYTLYTIGDGLVSQLPALLVSVAAGIVITRVENKSGAFLGRDIFVQLGAEPQAVATSGGVLLLLSLVPALPGIPFFVVGVILLSLARKTSLRQKSSEQGRTDSEFRPKVFSPLVLVLSPGAAVLLQRLGTLPKAIHQLRSEMFQKWGVIVPDVQFDLEKGESEIALWVTLHGVQVDSLRGDEKDSGVFVEKTIQCLQQSIEAHLSELIDDTQTRMLLEVHQSVAEDLINSVIPEMLSITALTTILRQLVIEGIHIRQMRSILQAVAESHLREQEMSLSLPSASGANSQRLQLLGKKEGATRQGRELLADVRISLKRVISKQITDDNWNLQAFICAPLLEQIFSSPVALGAPIEPGIRESILNQINKAFSTQNTPTKVLLTSKQSRTNLFNLIRFDCPMVSVIAIDELAPEVTLSILGEIKLETGETADSEEQEGGKSKKIQEETQAKPERRVFRNVSEVRTKDSQKIAA